MGVLLFAAAAVALPPAASAQAGAPGVTALASCSTFRIESTAANLAIRYEPYVSSPAITVAQRGNQYDCVRFIPNGYTLGGRYTACGVTNGNGWIGVAFYQSDGSILVGYTYQACVRDI